MHLEEDEPSQECKDGNISSLPNDIGHQDKGYLNENNGFWIPDWAMSGVIASQKYFQACDTDILLVDPLKVGTTWSKAILLALMNRMHYPDLQEHLLLTNIPHDLVPLSGGDIYTKKRDSTCKIVYVYRNPKDTFVSLWHFQNRLYPTTALFEEAFDKFCRGMSPFGPYWDHVLSCWKESIQNPSRKMLVLKYENMTELCSFDNLSNLDVNKSGRWRLPDHKMTLFSQGVDNVAFFRQGNTGDWVNYLTPEMTEKLNHIIEEKFHVFLQITRKENQQKSRERCNELSMRFYFNLFLSSFLFYLDPFSKKERSLLRSYRGFFELSNLEVNKSGV
ncbi:hypothetical protein I3760_05G046900 [Carya illinoinensis]|nr:hypothetical protein I3760_05G046900 [Carya illinoinensis]